VFEEKTRRRGERKEKSRKIAEPKRGEGIENKVKLK
jgi:hypothetical protein